MPITHSICPAFDENFSMYRTCDLPLAVSRRSSKYVLVAITYGNRVPAVRYISRVWGLVRQ